MSGIYHRAIVKIYWLEYHQSLSNVKICRLEYNLRIDAHNIHDFRRALTRLESSMANF